MKKIIFLFLLFPLFVSVAAIAQTNPTCTYVDWTSTLDPDPQWTSASREQWRASCGSRVFTAIGTTKVSCSRDCSCPSGSALVKDTISGLSSCVASSSSSSYSASSIPTATSSAPCLATEVRDSIYGMCRPKVTDGSQCGNGGYLVTQVDGKWCAGHDYSNPAPDGFQCDLVTTITSQSTSNYWSCFKPVPSSAASSASGTSSGAASSASGDASSSGAVSSSPSSASNTSVSNYSQALAQCELNFGSGKCKSTSLSTPCPNTYTSNNVSFCITSALSNSNSSGSGSSLGSGNAVASNCTNEPTCTGGDSIQCAVIKQVWINNCDGIDKKINIDADQDNSDMQTEFDNLVNDNQTDLNQDGTISGVNGEIDISQYADMVGNLNNAASQGSSGNCPPPRNLQMSFGTYELSYQPMCDLADGISYFVLLFFSITGSLIIYRTVERI